jgi:hypothetical protein
VHPSFQPSKQLLEFIFEKLEIEKPHNTKKLEEFKLTDPNDLIVVYFELGDEKKPKIEDNIKNISRYIETKGRNFSKFHLMISSSRIQNRLGYSSQGRSAQV